MISTQLHIITLPQRRKQVEEEMNRLKIELKIDFDIDADKPKKGATNPQSIAQLNGNQQ